jgi:hypothetical protein
MDEADRENERIVAYLQNRQFEAVEDYVGRGRQFADIDDKELDRRWIAAFKIWVAAAIAGVQNDHRERLDLDSEIALRGREAPHDSVVKEWQVLQIIIAAQVSKQEVREKLKNTAQEILEFEKTVHKRPPN